jgi:hypothetical protein
MSLYTNIHVQVAVHAHFTNSSQRSRIMPGHQRDCPQKEYGNKYPDYSYAPSAPLIYWCTLWLYTFVFDSEIIWMCGIG